MAPVAVALGDLIGCSVQLVSDWHADTPPAGTVWLLENVRFNQGEKSNDEELARRYASLCDVFVMDASNGTPGSGVNAWGDPVCAYQLCGSVASSRTSGT